MATPLDKQEKNIIQSAPPQLLCIMLSYAAFQLVDRLNDPTAMVALAKLCQCSRKEHGMSFHLVTGPIAAQYVACSQTSVIATLGDKLFRQSDSNIITGAIAAMEGKLPLLSIDFGQIDVDDGHEFVYGFCKQAWVDLCFYG